MRHPNEFVTHAEVKELRERIKRLEESVERLTMNLARMLARYLPAD